MLKKLNLSLALFLFAIAGFAQVSLHDDLSQISYANPREYEIGGVSVTGIRFLDPEVLVHIAGLAVGQKIMVPGEQVTKAIQKLWEQGLFSNIKIYATKVIENQIFLEISLSERPRLSMFRFIGIKKSETDDIREKIKWAKGSQVTDNMLNNARNLITSFYVEKGFLDCSVSFRQKPDTSLLNHVSLDVIIEKGPRVKISEIRFLGNNTTASYSKGGLLWRSLFQKDANKLFTQARLKRSLKKTKAKSSWNIFRSSKFTDVQYKEDKASLIEKYNRKGFRDAKIVSDSIWRNPDGSLSIEIRMEEGRKFFFRNVSWVGNSKYTSQQLSQFLGIKKGDIYDQAVLEEKIYAEQTGVFSLYQDDGYLFSSISPVESRIENDSIDIEMQVYEGKQARLNNIIIKGNTKTNEHVIRREIRTKPGELYNRSDIIRTNRELATLGYFDPEKIGINPIPNPAEGTVDIEYSVEEKPSDQIELSGGWGANMVVGTLGLTFNNFSTRNFFNKSAWSPLPVGDGQKLSVRAQSNGIYYQSYSISFQEPWLGGKKPRSFSISAYHSIQSNGQSKNSDSRKDMTISGITVGLGKRLKFPDDFFTLENVLSFQTYRLNNWTSFLFDNGDANNLSFQTTLSRNSMDQPIYPRQGSSFALSLQITPPYSLFNGKDYSTLDDQEKYRWIEYHKWTFKASWFSRIAGDLVLNTRAHYGFLGYFNKQARSPFEGFNLGGDGLGGYTLYGIETIGLRGYDNGSLTPDAGGNIYNKLTMELRYPLSLAQSATIYGLAFLEGGNAWYDFTTFNPFLIKRSAGVGIRIFLPMIGMLGIDWGYGFDEVPGRTGVNKGQFHFVLGPQNY